MPRIWKDSELDWRAEIAEIKHRIELIAQRDGGFDPMGEKMDSLLNYGFGMAQRNGMDAAIQSIEVAAEENPACADVLRRLARYLRTY